MTDLYTWNQEHDPHRRGIEKFLSLAQEYMRLYPDRVPFKDTTTAHITINWMRGLLDRKPSTMGGASWPKTATE